MGLNKKSLPVKTGRDSIILSYFLENLITQYLLEIQHRTLRYAQVRIRM